MILADILHMVTPFDPLHGDGYGFWSGIGSGSPLLAGLGAWWHHNNCTEPGCWRKGHKDPEHGHPRCRRHQDKLAARPLLDFDPAVGRTTSHGPW